MKLISTSYSDGAFNFGALVLRLAMGGLLLPHGYDKLVHFAQYKAKFINFMGIGQTASLSLTVFAELFCSLFVILGLATRLAAIAPFIAMFVALWKGHNLDIFGKGEHAALFMFGFLVILVIGPGRASVDGAMGK
ncbi:DoxX family protein [Paraflavitalea sp. CAU 1676]|uniref:DoxX family protein n=1 Tax=Paraflavitalea sp. CAU 1676 TaxID=3032598 RepID=UPI0023DA2A25|nr:DoxX family protein [Paraflavitalea sp. CAU 1676]MDF2191794.1 DoxX family protein [Paraflavitalea sp. CAU 1676]